MYLLKKIKHYINIFITYSNISLENVNHIRKFANSFTFVELYLFIGIIGL